jgi:hypothetical protein
VALRNDLIHNWAIDLIQKGSFLETEQLLDRERVRGGLSEREWRELTVYLYQVRAQSSARSDYAEAARLIQEGLNKVGTDQDLSKSYEVYIHNSVVTLARDERYAEALSLLDTALSLIPDSAVLQQDRSKVLAASGGR